MSKFGLLDSIWELEDNVHAQDRENSVLHQLAIHNQWQAIQQFLEDCDPKKVTEYIEMRNSTGSTPLHLAAYFGHIQTLKVLQNYNANGHYKNKAGWSAHNYAARWSQPLDVRMTIGLLQKNPGKASAAFSFRAVREKQESMTAGDRAAGDKAAGDKAAAPNNLPTIQLRQGPARGQARYSAQVPDTARLSGLMADSGGLKLEDRLKSDSGISVFDSKEVLNCV